MKILRSLTPPCALGDIETDIKAVERVILTMLRDQTKRDRSQMEETE